MTRADGRRRAASASGDEKNPLLLDQFLNDAIEVDVDVVADGQQTIIGGVMEHIEEAGIHSGDSACALPPYSLSPTIVDDHQGAGQGAGRASSACVGLMNVQFAVKDDERLSCSR